MVLMAWNDPPPPPKHGVWEHWTYGPVDGWTLRCGPMFAGDVRRVGEVGPYYSILNAEPMGVGPDAEKLKEHIDEEIVRRVREMLPAYKLLRERIIEGTG